MWEQQAKGMDMTRAIGTAAMIDPETGPEQQTARGADLVCIALERAGVDVIFGYPGGASLHIYDALPDHPTLRHILVRHEQGATHMADGYARATGRAGVVLVTSGPGATNITTGLACAQMDSVPMVAITGQVGTSLMGREAFQETDVIGMVMPITKHAFLVKRAEDIIPTIHRAFEIAHEGRPGPVVVDIPKDITAAMAPITGGVWRHRRSVVPPSPGQIARAVALLAAAERPLIVAGHGVRIAGAHAELLAVAERLDAPVAWTLLGIGGFPEEHTLAVGMLGMHGSAPTNHAVNEADVILAVGVRFDDRVTGKVSAFAKQAKIIHVDIDLSLINKNVPTAVGVLADARSALQAILSKLPRTRAKPSWHGEVAARRARPRPRLAESEARVELAPRQVIRAIREVAAPDAYFVTDVGQHQMWAAQHLGLDHPDRFVTSGGLGAMGFALPAALGAQVGRPGSEVWAIAGDGGAQMTIQEIGTAVADGLPVKLAILNNGYLGMVRQWQQLFYHNRISQTPISSPDYEKLADAYGALGITVNHRDELKPALERAKAHPGPVILDIRIEREANVWPIVPPGGANLDLIEEPGSSHP